MAWAGSVHVSPPERDALAALVETGLKDCFRLFDQPEKTFSWWTTGCWLTGAMQSCGSTSSWLPKLQLRNARRVTSTRRHARWSARPTVLQWSLFLTY